MSDHSATIHTINGIPASGETTADVLASIRRLIAQNDTGSRRDAPPLRRVQHDGPHDGPAPSGFPSPDRGPQADRPLQLRRDALIPPAETPSELPNRRLRLATAEGGAVPEQSDRVAQDIHAAPDTGGQDAQPAMSPPDTEPDISTPRPFALSPSRISEALAPVPELPDAGATAAAQMAQTDAQSPHPANADDSTALHLFAPADEDIPNGSILRSLLREAIRQELQGEMGGRFSRNLRRVIRQEVACAIDEALSRRA